jgi:hypothetical protein
MVDLYQFFPACASRHQNPCDVTVKFFDRTGHAANEDLRAYIDPLTQMSTQPWRAAF